MASVKQAIQQANTFLSDQRLKNIINVFGELVVINDDQILPGGLQINDDSTKISFAKKYFPGIKNRTLLNYAQVFRQLFGGSQPLTLANLIPDCDDYNMSIIEEGLENRFDTLDTEIKNATHDSELLRTKLTQRDTIRNFLTINFDNLLSDMDMKCEFYNKDGSMDIIDPDEDDPNIRPPPKAQQAQDPMQQVRKVLSSAMAALGQRGGADIAATVVTFKDNTNNLITQINDYAHKTDVSPANVLEFAINKIKDFGSSCDNINNEHNNTAAHVVLLRSQLAESESNMASIKTELDTIKPKFTENKDELAKAESKIATLSREHSDVKAIYTAGIANAERVNTELLEKLQELTAQILTFKDTYNASITNITDKEGEKGRLEAKIDAMKKLLDDARRAINDYSTNLTAQEKDNANLLGVLTIQGGGFLGLGNSSSESIKVLLRDTQARKASLETKLKEVLLNLEGLKQESIIGEAEKQTTKSTYEQEGESLKKRIDIMQSIIEKFKEVQTETTELEKKIEISAKEITQNKVEIAQGKSSLKHCEDIANIDKKTLNEKLKESENKYNNLSSIQVIQIASYRASLQGMIDAHTATIVDIQKILENLNSLPKNPKIQEEINVYNNRILSTNDVINTMKRYLSDLTPTRSGDITAIGIALNADIKAASAVANVERAADTRMATVP